MAHYTWCTSDHRHDKLHQQCRFLLHNILAAQTGSSNCFLATASCGSLRFHKNVSEGSIRTICHAAGITCKVRIRLALITGKPVRALLAILGAGQACPTHSTRAVLVEATRAFRLTSSSREVHGTFAFQTLAAACFRIAIAGSNNGCAGNCANKLCKAEQHSFPWRHLLQFELHGSHIRSDVPVPDEKYPRGHTATQLPLVGSKPWFNQLNQLHATKPPPKSTGKEIQSPHVESPP